MLSSVEFSFRLIKEQRSEKSRHARYENERCELGDGIRSETRNLPQDLHALDLHESGTILPMNVNIISVFLDSTSVIVVVYTCKRFVGFV